MAKAQSWMPLVAGSNPTGGALVVRPGMLFPSSRGIEAAANPRLSSFFPSVCSGRPSPTLADREGQKVEENEEEGEN